MTIYAINLSKIVDPAIRDAFTSVLLLMQQLGNAVIGTSGTSFSDLGTPTGTINGVNDTFTLSVTPNPAASLLLFKNGVLQTGGGVDYTLTGATVVYVAGAIPQTGDAHVYTCRF